MVLLEAVTAAADCFDTSCRQNFCANFSAGKTELRDAIAAGAQCADHCRRDKLRGAPYLAHEASLS